MKKILFAATAALMAFVGCVEQKPLEPETPADSIELSAESATFEEKGGHESVMVTSSGAWTLTAAEEYNWVTPSMKEGEDGDIVKFEVAENYEADRQAEFTFAVGEAKAKFTVFSYAGELPAVKILSDAEVSFSYEEGKLEIVATSPLNYRDLKATLSAGAEEWLEYKATLSGDTDNDAKINYVVKALTGLENRNAEITISGEGLVPAVVKVSQLAKLVLTTDNLFYKAELAGGEVEVPLTTNVEYDINIAAEGEGWLTYSKKSEKGEIFSVTALESGQRSADVTFTQKNAKGEPLTLTVKISQVGTLINWAVDMTKNRVFPKWQGTGYGPSSQYGEFTLEVLFKANDFDRPSGGIFTLMGVEGQFLLRFGDVGNPVDHLQLALNGFNENMDMQFEPNRWYHLAITFNAGAIKVYVDGKVILDKQTYFSMINIFPSWSYEPTGSRTFWYGYSYNKDRDFHGLMTEFRAWARTLSAEEINAPGHFYSVPEDSEGLMTYWKCTEGEGNVIANKSTNKGASLGDQPLSGELNIQEIREGYQSTNKGDEGIKWVSVALPDK